MERYAKLNRLVRRVTASGPLPPRWDEVIRYLVDVWLDDYAVSTPSADVLEVTTSGFSYLFDVAAERLIAAWGISRGRHEGPRDTTRMAGHPRTGGLLFDRGHAIPHTLGGATDINLVPQSSHINRGAFRRLEQRAVEHPNALYFSCWRYFGAPRVRGGPSQIPTGVDQAVLVPGGAAEFVTHRN